MKKYTSPEVELQLLMAQDVITASQGGSGSGNSGKFEGDEEEW